MFELWLPHPSTKLSSLVFYFHPVFLTLPKVVINMSWFFFFLQHYISCRGLYQGLNQCPWQWKQRVLTTGLPRNPHKYAFLFLKLHTVKFMFFWCIVLWVLTNDSSCVITNTTKIQNSCAKHTSFHAASPPQHLTITDLFPGPRDFLFQNVKSVESHDCVAFSVWLHTSSLMHPHCSVHQ